MNLVSIAAPPMMPCKDLMSAIIEFMLMLRIEVLKVASKEEIVSTIAASVP